MLIIFLTKFIKIIDLKNKKSSTQLSLFEKISVWITVNQMDI